MASKTAAPPERTGSLNVSSLAVVDLSDDAPAGGAAALGLDTSPEAFDPLSSLGALATALDSFDDVPTFLNSLIAPHLPPTLPASSGELLQPDLAPIDKQLNDLLTRLSLLSQDTSSALEQSIHDVSRTVPRLTYDLQFMRESAVSLQGSLQLVQDRVARQTAVPVSPANDRGTGAAASDTDEARTHRALERLSYLDKLKTRMESARDVLAEAESWSALESEITSFIADKKWTKAGERLAEASKSLKVFQSADGEYESKRSLLVSLQNELETALSAALKDAIARVDTAACASFHDIFRMMDRATEFQNYYISARRTPVIDAWGKAALSDTDDEKDDTNTTAEPETFNSFLPKFYAVFLDTITSERAQIPLIFPTESSASILSQFIQSALDELSPSFHSRLSGLAEYHGPKALPELIRAFQATELFGLAVQNIMDKLSFNSQGGVISGLHGTFGSPTNAALSPTSPSSSLQKHSRTPSTHPARMSVSHRFSRSMSIATTADGIGSPSSSPSPWETTLYEPFLDLQSTYPTLEKRYLLHLLQTEAAFIGPISKDNPARTLTDRAVAMFSIGEDAIVRCLSFTHGYGALGLVDALNHLVQTFLTNNTDILEDAQAAARLNAGQHDELDFDGLDYSTEDWGAFQLGLHVLESCRGVRDRLTAFEGKLTLALSGINSTLNITPAEPASFAMAHMVTTIGAISLLQQSTLNSAELHTTISGLTTPSRPQFTLSRARDAVSTYTRTAQVFLQGIILSPLQAQLEGYPSLPVWSQPDKAPRRGELHIPSFSLSPTDTIARVSEGLLNLLRVFEVYAADDALAFSIETLPFVDVDSLKELLDPSPSKPADALAGNTTPGGTPGTPVTTQSPSYPGLTAEAVLSTWVSSLALSLLSHLTRSTLPAIRSLSSKGAAQLASDLGYLSNAVRALDVEWDDLERWREAAECKDQQEWRERAGDEVKKGVWAVVGMLRGWS
jgi:hypothetical protein